MKNMKGLFAKLGIVSLLVAPLVAFLPMQASAENLSVNFESPTYTAGSISGQDGWSNAVNPAYDQAVVSNTYGYATFGGQTFRISDATTSGSFGDWVFAKPLANAAGETSATAGSFSTGTLQSHFEAQFDFASTQAAQQAGMHISVSPDRGDGSRMSYLRFVDGANGIDVFFDQVLSTGVAGSDTFDETLVATGLSRSTPHTAKFVMDFVDGPSNDVVKIYIDGSLVKTGTSWEDYYRYDTEAASEQTPRIVKTLIIQARGVATPADAGKGYLLDNLSLTSGAAVDQTCSTITLVSGANTQTAGYTETTQAGPATSLLPASYSGTSFAGATVTQPVVPPWVDPSTDSNFTGSGALWTSTHATWPGGAGNTEGDPHNDQWRLFQDNFTLPAGAVVSSATLSYTADNAADAYLNGNSTPLSTTNDTYGAVPGALPQYFASVFNTPFTPAAGSNTLNFVVRNWGGADFANNPTGLLYKATINYCVPVTPPPTTVTVTIAKYVDSAPATAAGTNNASFPLTATWNAQNIGAGSGNFSLGPNGFNNPNAYQATTSDMTSGADYGVVENVATTCTGQNAYQLLGYTTGDSLAAAVAAAPPVAQAPNLTNITSNKFIIVWNHPCPVAQPIKVHILKYLDGNKATTQSANNFQFPMTSSWDADNIGAGSGSYVLGTSFGGAADVYGADTAAMSAPADYTTSETTDDNSPVLPTDSECVPGKYQLVGYSTSAVSFADAATMTPTTTVPNFSDISNDQYIIVWNKTCATKGTLTVNKATIGAEGDFNFTGDGGIGAFTISTTAGAGSKTFTNLTPGTYHITEASKSGWTQLDTDCNTVVVTAGGDDTCTVTNGKNSKLGEIRGTKIEDRDGDGKLKDGDHHHLSGWTIYLDTNNNGSLDSGEPSQVTNNHGDYRFKNLPAGTYHVREVMKPGWVQTYPTSGKYDINLGTSQIAKNKNFGNFKLGTISGMKFNDKNSNGHKNQNEPGLAGWTIKLTKPDGSTITTVTDANGKYSFSNLGPGTYKVREVQQTGWKQITSDPSNIRLRSGTTVNSINFGNHLKTDPNTGPHSHWNGH